MTYIANNPGTSSTNTSSSPWYNIQTQSSTSTIIYPTGSIGSFTNCIISSIPQDTIVSGNLKIQPGMELSVTLPDGAILNVTIDGSYKIVDKDAQITYKANNVREFNRYINGSDLLEEFIKFISRVDQKINKQEFFNLPVELFIQWLVIRAAEQDGEDPDYTCVIKALPNPNKRNRHSVRCKSCGKFIINRELLFCSREHMNKYSVTKNIF